MFSFLRPARPTLGHPNSICATIKFYEQYRASVTLKVNAPPEDLLAPRINLFSLYAVRQLCAVGGPEAASTATLLSEISKQDALLNEVVRADRVMDCKLVEDSGASGRCGFNTVLHWGNSQAENPYLNFTDAPGFGWLGKGLSFYVPYSVLLLMNALWRDSTADARLQKALRRTCAHAGSVILSGEASGTGAWRQGQMVAQRALDEVR